MLFLQEIDLFIASSRIIIGTFSLILDKKD